MKRQTGVTLLELMIVVAIVAILGSIGVPAYRDYVMRARLNEAYATLSAQRVRMEQFYQDLRTYTGACTAGTVAPPMTDTEHFTFGCAIAGDGQSYLLQGNGSAVMAGFAFTVDQNNNRVTTGTPSGWTASATCWIRDKGGHC
jgi:type IV pilus assembly protein PilE